MEKIIEFFNQYKMTIATAMVGLILYLGKQNYPELMSAEFMQSVDVLVTGVIIFLIGRFTRMTASDAVLLEEIKTDENKNQI